jgi:predicted Co/Zn/Cd cation transporter (cation efflux family)
MSPLKQYVLAWAGLPFIAIFNGLLRELTYSSIAGEKTGHQISSILLSIIICFYVVILNSRVTLKNSVEAFSAGSAWLIFTIAFEILVGFIAGTSMSQQMQNYNVVDGHLWVVVLVTVFFAPVLLRRRTLHNIFG